MMSTKRYALQLTRRQMEALVRAVEDSLADVESAKDLVALSNAKHELAYTLLAIERDERDGPRDGT